ncbi:hypothetical protein D4S03_11155 [bacterium]|jgi:hypothetical protein|nr:MAG: hypothetical protein D4S03_11155 [bacterium]
MKESGNGAKLRSHHCPVANNPRSDASIVMVEYAYIDSRWLMVRKIMLNTYCGKIQKTAAVDTILEANIGCPCSP